MATGIAKHSFALSSMQKKLANGIGFQLNWFVCIFAAPHWSLLSTLLLLSLHYAFIDRAHKQWMLIVIIALIGYSADSILSLCGIISFADAPKLLKEVFAISIAPVWMFCLWLSFTTCLHHAFSFLYQKPVISFIVCFSVIPFNYYVGANFRGASFADPWLLSLSLIGLYWALLLPLAIKLSNQE